MVRTSTCHAGGRGLENCTRDDGHQTFKGVPRDDEIFEPSSMAHDSRTFQDGDFSHVPSLQRAGPKSDYDLRDLKIVLDPVL